MSDQQPQKPVTIDTEPVRLSHPQAVKKRRKKIGCMGLIMTLLIAIIVGGASGAAVNYYMNQNNIGVAENTNTGGNETKVKVVEQDAETGNYNIADIAEIVVPTVVGVTNYGEVSDIFGQSKTAKQAAGSGVIIRSDGTIVTNFHVIAGASKITVTLSDGKNHDAKVIGYDQASDLAVIKIDGKDLPAIAIGDSGKLRVGDLAVAVGNPLGENFSQTVTDGIISGINRKLEMGNQTFNLIQTNCAINSGNSGGALVNGRGELIGINSVKIQAQGVEGLGFAIPINNVMTIVKEIEKNGIEEKPFVGISGYSLTPEMAAQLHIEQDSGLIVMQIVKDGPADQAGIRPGDIITEVDGQEVKSFEDMSKLLTEKKIGDKIVVGVQREQEKLDVQLTLGVNENVAVPRQ